ncbi:piriformospora indica-insensitive protein 2-like [Sesamum indicum]|uniref:Piriformospora indica-insensitive protein 2-like n=1 Tax=Sesamum indicum TaxID=4182 RepID=A0A6I9U746_SESIN|nr:piriformospora indica-insensitive protein 2-like [Sesamum indicum]
MAFLSLVLVGFLVFLAANGVMCSDTAGAGDGVDMEEEELFGLFEVMGSLLEDPTWAQMHPQPCTETPWPGVECELLEETFIFHVTKIHVGPDIITPPCKTSAKISESLLKLPYLKTLSLINCFTESPVSLSTVPLFGALSFLEHLALESNPSLSGEIPSSISNLANLKILCLSQNNLSGEIPKEIGGLANLQHLDLSHNNLTGSIPEEIGKLEKLAILDISWNSLQEVVPTSTGGLQFLEKIDLSSNKLQGRLPQELGKLKRLVLLDLSHNSLTGPIPENLSGLQQLQYLIMDANPLNASFPSFIGSLIKLRVLSFSGCGLTGPISATFSNLTNLTALFLDNNSLNGTVPPELGTLPSMNALNFSRNQLSGELLFPQAFIHRLGKRLDIRENNGLCTNQEAQDKNTSTSSSSRFLENPFCSSAMFPAASNKTVAEKSPDMKPKLYNGNRSSNARHRHDEDKEFVLLPPVLMLLLLLFGS